MFTLIYRWHLSPSPTKPGKEGNHSPHHCICLFLQSVNWLYLLPPCWPLILVIKGRKKLLPCLYFPLPLPKPSAFILPLFSSLSLHLRPVLSTSNPLQPWGRPVYLDVEVCVYWYTIYARLSPTSTCTPFPTDTPVPNQDRQRAPWPWVRPLPAFWWVEQHRISMFSENSDPRHCSIAIWSGLAISATCREVK